MSDRTIETLTVEEVVEIVCIYLRNADEKYTIDSPEKEIFEVYISEYKKSSSKKISHQHIADKTKETKDVCFEPDTKKNRERVKYCFDRIRDKISYAISINEQKKLTIYKKRSLPRCINEYILRVPNITTSIEQSYIDFNRRQEPNENNNNVQELLNLMLSKIDEVENENDYKMCLYDLRQLIAIYKKW